AHHTGDFGEPGFAATIRPCKAAGLVVAGTGMDLEEAREPGYLETKHGRVALISAASGNKSNEWAGLGKGGLRGRPGINPLRVDFKYVLEREAVEQMKAIARKLDLLREAGRSTSSVGVSGEEFSLQLPGEQSSRGSSVFVPGDKFE